MMRSSVRVVGVVGLAAGWSLPLAAPAFADTSSSVYDGNSVETVQSVVGCAGGTVSVTYFVKTTADPSSEMAPVANISEEFDIRLSDDPSLSLPSGTPLEDPDDRGFHTGPGSAVIDDPITATFTIRISNARAGQYVTHTLDVKRSTLPTPFSGGVLEQDQQVTVPEATVPAQCAAPPPQMPEVSLPMVLPIGGAAAGAIVIGRRRRRNRLSE